MPGEGKHLDRIQTLLKWERSSDVQVTGPRGSNFEVALLNNKFTLPNSSYASNIR